MPDRYPSRLPWREIDAMMLALGSVLGLGAWIAASVGVSYAPSASAEIAWANLGVVGLIVFGVANALWLLRGRRAVGLRRMSLVCLAPGQEASSGRTAGTPTPLRADEAELGPVRVARGRLIHRPSCPLVRGKALQPMEAGSSTSTAACQVCSP